ncbi:hypothetical protein E2C01_022240 [Portunus trituberculatus]|uniref:Uncharacterized protein n=1 Tax=Portunus trituberculatus TaxID=210409 RepID=A0A5B7E8D8_PORTR|nr:hypothetical protein [Portunus trituberculatus]
MTARSLPLTEGTSAMIVCTPALGEHRPSSPPKPPRLRFPDPPVDSFPLWWPRVHQLSPSLPSAARTFELWPAVPLPSPCPPLKRAPHDPSTSVLLQESSTAESVETPNAATLGCLWVLSLVAERLEVVSVRHAVMRPAARGCRKRSAWCSKPDHCTHRYGFLMWCMCFTVQVGGSAPCLRAAGRIKSYFAATHAKESAQRTHDCSKNASSLRCKENRNGRPAYT